MLKKKHKIYVAGHRGMVGSAIVRKLTSEGFENLLLKTSTELDLRNQQEVVAFFAKSNLYEYPLQPALSIATTTPTVPDGADKIIFFN